MNTIKIKLSALNFLQFAIWGSYLTCMGQFLAANGLAADIPLFYAVQGFVSIFMPALIGVVADKWIQGQRLLGLCHLLAAAFMLMAWNYAHTHTGAIGFTPLFTFYTLSVAFYMPTIALNNSVSFSILKSHGLDTVKDFPPIRVLGTVGFIAAMWFVNSAYIADGRFGMTLSGTDAFSGMRLQYTDGQLLVCAILGLVMSVYACMMPKVPVAPRSETKGKGIMSILGLDAFHLFRDSRMFVFFFFSLLLGMALQVTNSYATPFITGFKDIPEYAGTFGANNATLLTSISQISEAFCILLIPFFLRRFGIKKVMLIAMGAWVLRFGFFGIGNPGDGLWMLILSMLVYGVAFDFFNVSGALFVEQETHDSIKASAQGLFMLMTNGLGASIGMLLAGAVVNHYVFDNPAGPDWSTAWLIFAAYSLVVAVTFNFVFKYNHKPQA